MIPDSSRSRVPLSLIDFATIHDGERAGAAFARSLTRAQKAEELGFLRIWFAEHHNMRHIASSAPAVLIAYIGAHTQRIHLGAGGVMLPNHAPLIVAEQFATLAEMFPGRIELGVGRAPGTDQATVRALRRSPYATENFPQDVAELQAYLRGDSPLPGVRAVPGGVDVPVIILGSSLFGAQLAAHMGLPYAFASHFAPSHMKEAIGVYREKYQPSAEYPEPYVIAAVNVVAARTNEEADAQYERVCRERVRSMGARGRTITESQLDDLMRSSMGAQIVDMLRYTAVGDGTRVAEFLDEFARVSAAQELMVALQASSPEEEETALHILADCWGMS